jgi:hypothetical protein
MCKPTRGATAKREADFYVGWLGRRE